MSDSAKPTCFVISPIGEDESEVRSSANDFLELLVQPALERFGFDVIRADQIARPTFITTDIVRLVQEAELCIIDLTGNNPNVFYECGRRHESGKPFIQMISKSQEERLPFDVAGIRTVTYDLSTARKVLDSQRLLQQFVQQIMEAGFGDATSGESLTSVAKGIERLDRKIAQLLARVEMPRSNREEIGTIEFAIKPPNEAWRSALQAGRMDLAYKALTRLKQAAKYSEYLSAIGIMASMGEADAFAMLEDETEKLIERPATAIDGDADDLISVVVVSSIKAHFTNTGRLREGVACLERLMESVITKDRFQSTTKATLANAIGMLAWLGDDHDTTIKYSKMAADFNPDEPAYLYNLALAYESEEQSDDLDDTLVKLAKMGDRLDEPHRTILERHGIGVQASRAVHAGGEGTPTQLDDIS